jgi:hypothetical protein
VQKVQHVAANIEKKKIHLELIIYHMVQEYMQLIDYLMLSMLLCRSYSFVETDTASRFGGCCSCGRN